MENLKRIIFLSFLLCALLITENVYSQDESGDNKKSSESNEKELPPEPPEPAPENNNTNQTTSDPKVSDSDQKDYPSSEDIKRQEESEQEQMQNTVREFDKINKEKD